MMKGVIDKQISYMICNYFVCVCVCVCVRERERERGRHTKQSPQKCIHSLHSQANPLSRVVLLQLLNKLL